MVQWRTELTFWTTPFKASFNRHHSLDVYAICFLYKNRGCGARTRGQAGEEQAPPPQASLGAMCPTLEIPGQIHGVPGLVSGQLEALPAAQRTTTRFPEDHTSQQVSHPSRGRVPREDLGTWGRGGGPQFHARWSGPGRADARPRTGSIMDGQACAPPGRLRVLLWLKFPHPAPRRQTWTEWLQLSKVWAKRRKKGL